MHPAVVDPPWWLTPNLWWAGLVALALVWWNQRSAPTIPKRLNKNPRPGDLAGGGSDKTSKVESKLRDALVAAGFKPLPQGTLLVTHPDETGTHSRSGGLGQHHYTPDVILMRPHPTIVELDPHYTHRGFERIVDDVTRNRHYARLNYRVVRVRTGGAKRLSPNDVVLERDFNPDTDMGKIIRAIRSAKYLPARHWKDFAIRI